MQQEEDLFALDLEVGKAKEVKQQEEDGGAKWLLK